MELPKQKRGVLLFFPSKESATARPTNESCPECERLEIAYEDAIRAIRAAIHGTGTSSEKVAEMYRKQDERDRMINELYAHKAEAHARLKLPKVGR